MEENRGKFSLKHKISKREEFFLVFLYIYIILCLLAIVLRRGLELPVPFYLYIFAVLPVIGFIIAVIDEKNEEEFVVKWFCESFIFPRHLIFFIHKEVRNWRNRGAKKKTE